DDTLRGDVSTYGHRLGAGAAQLVRGLLSGAIVAEIADRNARCAEPREPERNRLADPARPARDEHRAALEGPHLRRGSGSYAGAELGTSSQPIRERGSRPPSSAFEDAYPSRSRSAICSSAYSFSGWPSGSSRTS